MGNMANLYVRFGDDAPMSLLAGGSNMAIVKAARSIIAETCGNSEADRLFGVRCEYTKAGTLKASQVERSYAGGLSAGGAFAVATPDVVVAGAFSLDQAVDAVGDAMSLLTVFAPSEAAV